MSSFLIIDSSYLTYKSYFAYPSLRNAKNQEIGALFGFIKGIMNTASKIRPDHIIFTRDLQDKTFRHDLDVEYKGNRKPMEDSLVSQLPSILDFQNSLSSEVYAKVGFEADDIIYSIVTQNHSPTNTFYVLSGDKDLYQLFIYSNVYFTKLDRDMVVLFTREDFEKKYELKAEQWVDFKALVGDGSDNFSGVSGIGKVGALKILQNCYNLYSLCKYLDISTEGFTPVDISILNQESKDRLESFVKDKRNQTLISKIKNSQIELAHSYKLSCLVNTNYLDNEDVNTLFEETKALSKNYDWQNITRILDENQFESLTKFYQNNFGDKLTQETLF
jgi:5'-3' exonuclease